MNVYENDWDVERERAGLRERFLHIGRRAGGELIGATMFEVGPGYRGPYHLHHGNEEVVLVVDGAPTLRTADGERELKRGDIEFFPRGGEGSTPSRTGRTGPRASSSSRRWSIPT